MLESKIPIPLACSSEFWDALAPYHAAIENNFLNLPSLRRIRHEIEAPVLVVGAGQGLIVAALQKQGLHCDGVDLSSEMISYARMRRGLTLIHADARALPFAVGTYRTVIYATGVIDFMSDEEAISIILKEGRRVVDAAGKLLVAFCRFSAAQEEFLARVDLLRNNVLAHRQTLELYLLNPLQMLAWIAHHANVGYFRAVMIFLAIVARTTTREKMLSLKMQRIFRNTQAADSLIQAAPETLPYRDEQEIKNLFKRLAIPIKEFRPLASCYIVQI